MIAMARWLSHGELPRNSSFPAAGIHGRGSSVIASPADVRAMQRTQADPDDITQSDQPAAVTKRIGCRI